MYRRGSTGGKKSIRFLLHFKPQILKSASSLWNFQYISNVWLLIGWEKIIPLSMYKLSMYQIGEIILLWSS